MTVDVLQTDHCPVFPLCELCETRAGELATVIITSIGVYCATCCGSCSHMIVPVDANTAAGRVASHAAHVCDDFDEVRVVLCAAGWTFIGECGDRVSFLPPPVDTL